MDILAKIKVLLLCFILVYNYGYSQNDSIAPKTPLNNIGLNFLGSGSVLSINYERLFVVNKLITISANTGLGVNYEFSMLSRVRRYIVFPKIYQQTGR